MAHAGHNGPGSCMVRPGHVRQAIHGRYCRGLLHHPRYSFVQYLPLFLLFMAVLIAAYFYLEHAKKRGTDSVVSTRESTEPTDSTPAS